MQGAHVKEALAVVKSYIEGNPGKLNFYYMFFYSFFLSIFLFFHNPPSHGIVVSGMAFGLKTFVKNVVGDP